MKPLRVELTVLFAMITGCLALLLASPVQAQNQALLGKWEMTSTAGEEDVQWTLIIDCKDGRYEATSAVGESSEAVSDLRVQDDAVHFTVEYQGRDYDIDLRVDGDSLTGTWSGHGDSGATKGHKIAKS